MLPNPVLHRNIRFDGTTQINETLEDDRNFRSFRHRQAEATAQNKGADRQPQPGSARNS